MINIEIRECITFDELSDCVRLQREVFALPEVELSPVRHLVVTKNAGGFTLGAFLENKLAGFVLSVPAFLHGEKALYSHMTAVKAEFQCYGIGAKLKWSQRERALQEDIKTIKWTFQPLQSRNAFFNLEKLGAQVTRYEPNFYGTDHLFFESGQTTLGLDSDRLIAEWKLESGKVDKLANGEKFVEKREPRGTIEIPNNWNELVHLDLRSAIEHQSRVKEEFRRAFKRGLVCRGFLRDETHPRYLFY